MSTAAPQPHLPPWLDSAAEEKRFRAILATVLAASLLLGIVVPLLDVEQPDLSRPDNVSPRLAKLVMERKPPPPPPPPEPEPVKEEPVPEPPVVEEPKPEPEPEPPPKPEPEKKPPPKPEPPPEARKEAAREKAARSGLLALSSELSALRQNEVIKKLKKKDKPLRRATRKPPPKAAPSVINKDIAKASGGIDTSTLSRETGTTELAEHVITQVVSPGSEDLAAQAGAPPTRSKEDIELVFDINKGRLNALYNRALRRNPALEGKVVLKLTIAPSGKVTACEIVSSELDDPSLERKLVMRVKLFDFGPEEDVGDVTITYPLEFFPG